MSRSINTDFCSVFHAGVSSADTPPFSTIQQMMPLSTHPLWSCSCLSQCLRTRGRNTPRMAPQSTLGNTHQLTQVEGIHVYACLVKPVYQKITQSGTWSPGSNCILVDRRSLWTQTDTWCFLEDAWVKSGEIQLHVIYEQFFPSLMHCS